MYVLTLKKGEEKRIEQGHPWVFANEVAKIDGKDVQGSIAKVVSSSGNILGFGFINHKSKILVRLLCKEEMAFDKTFFLNRIVQANTFRKNLGYENN